MPDLISVIVTTYDRDEALDAVLRSLSAQRDRNFEVVVADDGSGPATAAAVERWQQRLGRPLVHVRHPHQGFRAAEIRNRAVLASRGAYCIFLDGDCLAPPRFVARHRALAEQGHFVAGNRTLLPHALTERVLRERLATEAWTLRDWFGRRGDRPSRLAPLFDLPLGPLRKLRASAWRDARSCNLAVRRADLDRVDGFDMTYSGWGKEDSDLIVRLIRAGVARKDGMFAVGVLHLWHPDADRAGLSENEARFRRLLATDRVRAERGMSTLARQAAGLPEPAESPP